MRRPIHISKVIVEYNIYTLGILSEALKNYHKYVTDCLQFENYTPLSKGALNKRKDIIESMLEGIDL